MNNKYKITPLSKFPTEVILHFYRKNRLCYTDYRMYKEVYNWKTKKTEYGFHSMVHLKKMDIKLIV